MWKSRYIPVNWFYIIRIGTAPEKKTTLEQYIVDLKDESQENMIDFVTDRNAAVVSVTNKKYINMIKKYIKTEKTILHFLWKWRWIYLCKSSFKMDKKLTMEQRIFIEEQSKVLTERLKNEQKNKTK